MNVSVVIKDIANRLSVAGIENAAMEARWLTLETAKLSPKAFNDIQLSTECLSQILERVKRRINHEPLQYILQSAPFRNLDLFVSPAVLIPRPETELLVQWVIDNLPLGGSFLDLGTGSGAIALAVAQERPDAKVTAADCSSEALHIVEVNCKKYNLSLSIVLSNLFENLREDRFDIIGANLPYVTYDEYERLEIEVRDYEPELALTAADEGLSLINRTIEDLKFHLMPKGAAIFELSPSQANAVAHRLQTQGFYSEILKDYTGRDRFVCGKL